MFCCARRHRPHRVRGRRVRSKEGVRTAQGGVRRRESLPLPPRAAHARTRAHAEPQTASPRTGRHCLRSLLCRPVSDRPTRRDSENLIYSLDEGGAIKGPLGLGAIPPLKMRVSNFHSSCVLADPLFADQDMMVCSSFFLLATRRLGKNM